MAEQKKTSPATIALMVVGLIAVVGVIIWEVRALSGGPEKRETRPPAQATTAPGTEQGAASAMASKTGRPGVPGGSVSRSEVLSNANPFEPLPGSTAAAAPSPKVRPLPPPPTPSAGTVPAPVLVARDRQLRAAALNASLGGGDQSQQSPRAQKSGAMGYLPPAGQTQIPVVPPEPVLLGTMLGARPVAVFQAEKSSVIVPQGGVFMGWKVLRVSHGEVTVAVGPTRAQLRVGAASASAMPSTRSASAMPDAETYAAGNGITVHYTGRPALSHRELVYGRMDDETLSGQLEEPIENGDEVATEPETQPIGQPASPPEVQQTGSS